MMESLQLPKREKKSTRQENSAENQLREQLQQLMQAKPIESKSENRMHLPQPENPYPTERLNKLAQQLKELSNEQNNADQN